MSVNICVSYKDPARDNDYDNSDPSIPIAAQQHWYDYFQPIFRAHQSEFTWLPLLTGVVTLKGDDIARYLPEIVEEFRRVDRYLAASHAYPANVVEGLRYNTAQTIRRLETLLSDVDSLSEITGC
jgi:hypothetical protein